MKWSIGALAGSCLGGQGEHIHGAIGGVVGVTLLISLLLIGSQASAQTLTTLLTFSDSDGSLYYPEGGLTLWGSTLYGMTQNGGVNSTGGVFSLPVSGGTATTLFAFGPSGSSPLGNNPQGWPTLSPDGSTVYGNCSNGGVYEDGTAFSVPASGGTATTLFSFGNSPNGTSPDGSLILIGSTLYGTARFGGAHSYGTVFSLPVTGGTATTLCAFDGSNGEYPNNNSLTLSGSTLYGTTSEGGTYNDGTVFSVPVSGGTATALFSFGNVDAAGGLTPSADGSTLYGMTDRGGASNNGALFSLSVSGGTTTTLLSFSGTQSITPQGSLILSDSTLYGMIAISGPVAGGEIFSINTSGGNYTDLFDFNGANPVGNLVLDGSTLYGTTFQGGAYGEGTVFSLNLAPVPEPSSLALLGAGIAGLLWWASRRRSAMRTPEPLGPNQKAK